MAEQIMKLIWTDPAEFDLEDIQQYIYNDNPKAAPKVALYIIDKVEALLPQNPRIGRAGQVLGTRELVIQKYPYIVPYRVIENKLYILRVLHTSKKLG
ncbi:MAG: type II toxin-antitoxin system RelE/ParE family toxin [Heliobacteriaceae bacterium]|jgi:toxin ParE1/3/4|nr:type II toxin-antitoxin system RelE/ParE family toxin [Heliobacteriaceae bacterium]